MYKNLTIIKDPIKKPISWTYKKIIQLLNINGTDGARKEAISNIT